MNKLKICPDTPNCINTEYSEEESQYLPSIDISNKGIPEVVKTVKRVMAKMGGILVEEKPGYITFTFTSMFFQFVDDFEIRLDEQTKQLHIRSASRIGYTDFGANRKRVLKFMMNFNKAL